MSALSAPGYCTFTATTRPSCQTALCTWPIDAAAAGLSSNSAKRARQSSPSSSRRIAWIDSAGSGGAASCSLVRAARYGPATSSGIAASKMLMAWPIFMAPPLSSPRTWNICSAVRACSSACTISAGLPPIRLPNPHAVRPRAPPGPRRSARCASGRSSGSRARAHCRLHGRAARGHVRRPATGSRRGDAGDGPRAARSRRAGAGRGRNRTSPRGAGASVHRRTRSRGLSGGQLHEQRVLRRARHCTHRVRPLHGQQRPRRVGVPPMQVGAAQARGESGHDQRADDGAIAQHPQVQVRQVLQRVVEAAGHVRVRCVTPGRRRSRAPRRPPPARRRPGPWRRRPRPRRCR